MSNLIVCPEPLAAEMGRRVFSAGGNATDAGVAACFVQAVTNPLLCGLGGSSLWYYYDHERHRAVVLNGEASIGSRPVPAHWSQEYVGRSETIGRYIIESEANQVGHQSVMTPGFVASCWEAHRRYGSGRLSWSDLLEPAARLAKNGFEVYPYIADFWQDTEGKPGYPDLMTKLHATPDAQHIYLKPDGSIYSVGDRFVQPELGETIERLANAGGDDFYTGAIAEAISDDFARHAGFVTSADLRDYTVHDEPDLRGRYRGLEVSSAIAPSAGPQLIQMLHILEHFDLGGLKRDAPAYLDLLARVQRASFADNVRLKGTEPEEARRLEREIVSPERAAYWAERIEQGDRIVVRGGGVAAGTTHVTCIDSERNAVSCCHSIGSLGGSGAITPGLGFLYNNFLGHFNPLPDHPDSIAPGKRAGGSLPLLVFRGGKPYIAVGAPGGSRIVTAVAQSLINVVDHGLDMRTAVTVPRIHSEQEQLIFLEPAFRTTTEDALRVLGNDVQRSSYQARVQAILVRSDTAELEAGPDPRGGAGVGHHA